MRQVLLFAMSVAALAACSHQEALHAGAPVTLTNATVPIAAPRGDLDDAAIARVAAAVTEDQAWRARLAEERSSDRRIREFAARVTSDLPVATADSIVPARRSSTLEAVTAITSAEGRSYLADFRESTFDAAYAASEQDALAEAVALFEQRLIPNATSEELKSKLVARLHVLKGEYADAQHLGGAVFTTKTALR
jgi:predicted outer membrane protein